MPTLPATMIAVLRAFAPLFSPRVWSHAQVLLVGAILAPAQRTVAAALRVTGRAQGRQFHRYHRVLSRAAWSGLAVGRVLLGLLVAAFVPTGPLLFGIDETLERRRGKRIAAKGIYRDPVRSSRSHFVKASGLRSRLPDAAGAPPVGGADLGAARADRAGTLRTIQSRARTTTQDLDGLGATTAPRGAPLVAGTRHRRRGGQHLRGAGVPRRRPRLARAGHGGDAPAPRRRPVRPRPAA
ncbi:MAG: transposase, partial [Thermomicrobiales bacterium]